MPPHDQIGWLALSGHAPRPRPSLAARIGGLLGTLAKWQDRRRQRYILQTLDDHMLHDIGISRADVDAEAKRQFWC